MFHSIPEINFKLEIKSCHGKQIENFSCQKQALPSGYQKQSKCSETCKIKRNCPVSAVLQNPYTYLETFSESRTE